MSNIEAFTRLVDGSTAPVHEAGEECDRFIERLHGDDIRPPPQQFELYITTKSGKNVRVVIPNSSSNAVVLIDGKVL